MRDGVRVTPKLEFIESIRREVSRCVEISDGINLRKWEHGLLWKIPFLLLSRPWRRYQPSSSEPDNRVSGDEVDVWLTFGASASSASVIESATLRNRPVVLFLGSNADIAEPQMTHPDSTGKYGERALDRTLAITKATKVVCQSEWQIDHLRKIYGIEGVLLRNPIDLQAWGQVERPQKDGVLWIGRYDSFHKRVDLAIEVAKRCPNIPFKLIVNRGQHEVEKEVRRQVIPNVTLIDYIPSSEIANEFAAAQAFLSTGSPEYEGFPNVLLQAAATQTPIVSLHDFDRFLESTGAGFACEGSIETAAELIQKVISLETTIEWTKVARYLHDHHSYDAAGARLIGLLNELKPVS